jgi:hypothetical protein
MQGGRAEVVLLSTPPETDYTDLITQSPAAGFLVKPELSARAIDRILSGRQAP